MACIVHISRIFGAVSRVRAGEHIHLDSITPQPTIILNLNSMSYKGFFSKIYANRKWFFRGVAFGTITEISGFRVDLESIDDFMWSMSTMIMQWYIIKSELPREAFLEIYKENAGRYGKKKRGEDESDKVKVKDDKEDESDDHNNGKKTKDQL